VSKWYLVLAALEKGWWWLAGLVLMSSLLAVVYVWRVIEICYFREPSAELKDVDEAPLSMLIPAWIFVIACIYFGLDTSSTVGTAAIAAQTLMEAMQ
jgi:multicomponent Na+:H+ antiporter subunit D